MISSLKIRLLLPIACLFVATLLILSFISRETTRTQFHKYLKHKDGETALVLTDIKKNEIAELIKITYSENLGWSGIKKLLKEQLLEFNHTAYVFDAKGKFLLGTQVTNETITLLDHNMLSVDKVSNDGTSRKFLLKTSSRSLYHPEDVLLGTIHFLPSKLPQLLPGEKRFIQAIDEKIFIIFTITSIFALLLMYWIATKVLLPVKQLTKAIEETGKGNFNKKISVKGNDEISRLSVAFNSMTEKLHRAEVNRKNMVSDLAHELRTPLTIMRGQIEAAEDGLIEVDRTLLQTLHSELLSLQYLVSDLQDLSLLESGHLKLNIENFDLSLVIKNVLSGMEIEVKDKSLILEVEVPDSPVMITSDQIRLQQIIKNLISNAIQYTDAPGKIVVMLKSDEEQVHLSISDSGRGIPLELQSSVFDRLYRVQPEHQHTSGTGLGLAIVKKLCQVLNGELTLTSEVGKGSTFIISLPYIFNS